MMTKKIAIITTILLAVSLALPVSASVSTTDLNSLNTTINNEVNNAVNNATNGTVPSVNTNGANVNAGNTSVTTGSNGTSVSAGNTQIQSSLDNGTTVQVGGLKVQTSKEGVNIDNGKGLTITTSRSGASVTLPEGSTGISADALKGISKLQLAPTQLFNTDLSKLTNLQVNANIQNGKVVYSLEDQNGQPVLTGETSAPVLNAGTGPLTFDVSNGKVTINNEQVVDYSKIMDELNGNKFVPLVGTTLAGDKIQIDPTQNGAEIKFTTPDGKEITTDVNSNFNIDGNKLLIGEGSNQTEVKILPPEINSLLDTLKTTTRGMAIGTEDSKPVYNLNVNEPFKLLWAIPTNMVSQYTVDAQNGNVLGVKSPWYSFLGTSNPFRDNFIKAIEKLIK